MKPSKVRSRRRYQRRVATQCRKALTMPADSARDHLTRFLVLAAFKEHYDYSPIGFRLLRALVARLETYEERREWFLRFYPSALQLRARHGQEWETIRRRFQEGLEVTL